MAPHYSMQNARRAMGILLEGIETVITNTPDGVGGQNEVISDIRIHWYIDYTCDKTVNFLHSATEDCEFSRDFST